MEVRFRPLQPSTLTHRVAAGQSSSETGPSFVEMIDSLTGAENNPDSNSPPDQQKRPLEGSRPNAGNPRGAENITEPPSHKPAASPTNDIPKAPVGSRIDLTA
jgi:hypothetical protein